MPLEGEPDLTLNAMPQKIFGFRAEMAGTGSPLPGQAFILVAQDGTGDTDSIAEGLTLVGSGGMVWVKEGTYALTAGLTMKSDVILRGSGPKTIISGTPSPLIDCAGTNNATIWDLNIQPGGAIGIACGSGTNLEIRSCFFSDAMTASIDCTNTIGAYIRDCHFLSISNTAILFTNAERVQVFDCWFELMVVAALGLNYTLASVNNNAQGCYFLGTANVNNSVQYTAPPTTGNYLHGCFMLNNALPTSIVNAGAANNFADNLEL